MVKLSKWQRRAQLLRIEAVALYLACKDRRTPWYAKALALAVVGYALSPIDLIPDFIPVVGYLDDLIIVPLGIALAVKLISPEVLAECRQQASEKVAVAKRVVWIAAGVIVVLWLILIFAAVLILKKVF